MKSIIIIRISAYRYIYKNRIENPFAAIQAALAFEVEGMLNHCLSTIISCLSVENICGNLRQFQNYDFVKKPLIEYVISNINDIKETENWTALCRENPTLVAEIISHQK